MTALRHPSPTPADLTLVLDAVLALPELPGDAPLPPASALLADAMRGWERIEELGRATELPPIAVSHLAELATLAGEVEALADRGGALAHLDLVGANVLIDGGGRVTFTGWQLASRGARIFDAVFFLFEQAARAPLPLLERLVATHPVFAEWSPDDVDAVIAGCTGRHFAAEHEEWGRAGLDWLVERRGWSEDGEAD